ncbi:(2Fe-2S) ferredoxin domain-containing protein [Scytonema hofmannii FACHB-248]|uniref:(2Fe-2S) ferredoxin domain-containing protein n=1 Tax=Scytonema hofmannii FACHB-248 TaxID=1842502 RepID=A0ABR8GMD2_9CYAN|nr:MULTISPECIES: (2Fe-2S) ferredoxin domain-containing protein [Nostocales]MBD2604572.1 (2Fe-2S) ferredoxin domain-containing protein [Scytonema hofmannii FACHB-248]
MSKFDSSQVSEFCIEGRFLDFAIKDGYKLKGLLLATAEGECYVKLAKDLRAAFNLELAKGTWLQVVGEKTLDLKTGEVKLKASRVMAGGIGGDRETGGQGDKGTRETRGTRGKATILVCQKSDCMKRGGDGVCRALESALSDRSLSNEVTIKGTGCMKNCKAGPNLVMPDKTRYSRIQERQVPALIDKHFADKIQKSENQREVVISTLRKL